MRASISGLTSEKRLRRVSTGGSQNSSNDYEEGRHLAVCFRSLVIEPATFCLCHEANRQARAAG